MNPSYLEAYQRVENMPSDSERAFYNGLRRLSFCSKKI
jgi:hypothetical protein